MLEYETSETKIPHFSFFFFQSKKIKDEDNFHHSGLLQLSTTNVDKTKSFFIDILRMVETMGDRLFNLFPSKIGINPFHATGLFLYPLSDLWISDVFRGYRKRPVELNELKHSMLQKQSPRGVL